MRVTHIFMLDSTNTLVVDTFFEALTVLDEQFASFWLLKQRV
jgi:hypothetical protein